MKIIKPDMIFHTGDFIDNFDGEYKIYDSKQNENLCHLYEKVRKDCIFITANNYFEVLGNHDV
jgi:hypothetical protein